jgi:hypothetical protein
LFVFFVIFCALLWHFIFGCGLIGGKIAWALKTGKFLRLRSHLHVVFSNCVALTRLFFEIRFGG